MATAPAQDQTATGVTSTAAGPGLTEKPWRNLPKETEEKLKETIINYAPMEEVKVKRSNILLIGPVGAGKSSFFNSINSIFKGHITSQACSGSAEHSLTAAYRQYTLRDPASGYPLKFRLCDTMGLEEGQGLDPNDVAAILDGHVPDKYQFNPNATMSPDTIGYQKSPTLDDRIHCIAFVIDGCTLDVFPDKILHKIQDIRIKANKRGIPQAVLLTKVDKLCPLVEKDITVVFSSKVMEDGVAQAAKLVGLPRAHVLPTKNYENEADLDPELNRLTLVALRTVLHFADDFLCNFLDAGGDA